MGSQCYAGQCDRAKFNWTLRLQTVNNPLGSTVAGLLELGINGFEFIRKLISLHDVYSVRLMGELPSLLG